MGRRRKWGLKRVEVEFNVLVGKVRLIFGKKEMPRQSTPIQRKKVRRVVQQELGREAATPKL